MSLHRSMAALCLSVALAAGTAPGVVGQDEGTANLRGAIFPGEMPELP